MRSLEPMIAGNVCDILHEKQTEGQAIYPNVLDICEDHLRQPKKNITYDSYKQHYKYNEEEIIETTIPLAWSF